MNIRYIVELTMPRPPPSTGSRTLRRARVGGGSRNCQARRPAKADRLVVHSDNGSPMKGATMLATLQRLGVVPSFSRPSVSDDNAFVEALFRTAKYRPGYPSKPFASIDAARAWVSTFVSWYNEEHQHSAIRFVTPADRHAGRDVEILNHRRDVYERARARHPERWAGASRNWSPVETVTLNPRHERAAERNDETIAA